MVEAPLIHALTRASYCGLDTAFVYMNEENIAGVLRERDRPEDVFLVTKLWRSHVSFDKADIARRLDDHLKALDRPRLSLWLMHWPGPGRDGSNRALPKNWCPTMRVVTFRHMVDLMKETGKVDAVGVCNFTVEQLEELAAHGLVPAVNQFEVHPMLPEKRLREYCAERGIAVMAYCSLGGRRGCHELLQHPTVVHVATEARKSAPQVLLRWAIQHGLCVVPGSSNPSHITENAAIFDFHLSESHMNLLDTLDAPPTRWGWLEDPADVDVARREWGDTW